MINLTISRTNSKRKIEPKHHGTIRVVETDAGYIWRMSKPDGKGLRGEERPTEIQAWQDAWPVAIRTGAILLATDHMAELVKINNQIDEMRHGTLSTWSQTPIKHYGSD